MNLLTLIPKVKLDETIDFKNFSLVNTINFNSKKINSIHIMRGNKKIKLNEVFDIKIRKIKSSQRKVVIITSKSTMDNLGYEWQDDHLEVVGNVGSFLGQKMKSGFIGVTGSCKSFLGSKMIGGEISINGNAGSYVGGPSFGEKFGMNGGKIFIKGNADQYLGYMMRRGLINVEGNVGEFCANNIIAGTIIIKKKIGKNYCSGMKRGSVILYKKPKNINILYKSCGIHELNFFSVLVRNIVESRTRINNKMLTFEKFVNCNSDSFFGEILIVKN
jgi:formylmethanofuran dehydrogenase subunit C